MANEAQGVAAHYGAANLAERILVTAAETGITEISPATLAPVDEFHTGGINSTRDLAKLAELQPGNSVIDLGCGIGGPARVLASEFGCDVTGVDLTPEFIEAAQQLTERCGLSQQARFETCDATALPFQDGSFDVAWTQHVVMNVSDRQAFYNEAARVLKPGGRFVFLDALRGDESRELDYPMPWARTPDISFVRNEADTRGFLAGAGLEEESWSDLTSQAVQAVQTAVAPGPFSLALVMGEDMRERVGHAGRAMGDGRIRIIRGLYRKPG